MNSEKNTRREFILKSAAATVGLSTGLNAFSYSKSSRIIGANEKIRVGFIGIGNRGSQLLNLFMDNPDCEVAAFCDVYEPYLIRDRSKVDERFLKVMPGQIPKMDEKFPVKPALYRDYRKLLEDKSIDAVCIATPDHWHALQTIDAIKAGKDVFVEKPLTITLSEGRKMLNAEAASDRIITVGLNRRGNSVYRKLAKEIPAGKIGKISIARAARINNMFPNGVGRLKPEAPPKDFDWDMWLGPRAYRPYQYNIAPYMFRWWSDYSTQMGNWGVHYMDVIRWLMGEKMPLAVTAHGSKNIVDHDGDIPDTMQVTFEFSSGAMISFGIYEASSGNLFPYGEIELRGTKGTLYANERGYQITPTRSGQFQTWTELMQEEKFDNLNRESLADGSFKESAAVLVRDFLDCIKSRKKPLCTLEDGHLSTSYAHLANISLAMKQRLEWDPVKEVFKNNKKANELLSYPYRKPWNLG